LVNLFLSFSFLLPPGLRGEGTSASGFFPPQMWGDCRGKFGAGSSRGLWPPTPSFFLQSLFFPFFFPPIVRRDFPFSPPFPPSKFPPVTNLRRNGPGYSLMEAPPPLFSCFFFSSSPSLFWQKSFPNYVGLHGFPALFSPFFVHVFSPPPSPPFRRKIHVNGGWRPGHFPLLFPSQGTPPSPPSFLPSARTARTPAGRKTLANLFAFLSLFFP